MITAGSEIRGKKYPRTGYESIHEASQTEELFGHGLVDNLFLLG